MSLEESIDALTIAVQTLTLAFQNRQPLTTLTYEEAMKPLPSGSPEKHAENIQREIDEARQVTPAMIAALQQTAADGEPEAFPNGKPSTTTDTSPPSSNESRTVTYDDVKNVTIAVSKVKKERAVAALARFGVTTAKALDEKQWLDYVVYMEDVLNCEIDPESSHE